MITLIHKSIVVSFSILLVFVFFSPAANAQWGTALSFDGVSGQYPITPVFDTRTDNFTLEAWVYWQGANTSGNGQFIVANGSNAGGGKGYSLALFYQNPYPLGFLFNNLAWAQSSPAVNLPMNTWVHVALVRESGIVSLYENGNQIPYTGDGGSFPNTTAPQSPVGSFRIGGDSTSYKFKGYIDEVRFSSIARYSGSTYTVPTDTFSLDANTIALYHFDEGSGTSASDATGSHNLTLRNSPGWVTNTLPVELSSFTAIANSTGATLVWKTATEVNNYGFEVERRAVGKTVKGNWEKVGFVKGNGTSNSPKQYSFTDANLTAGRYAYRLKQVDNNGMFKYYSSAEVEIGALAEFGLGQNYPNPFNPTTTIKYNVPVGTYGNISMKVYDIMGREVATLVNEMKEAGSYEVTFDGSKLASGLYFYKLQVGTLSAVKKLMLVK